MSYESGWKAINLEFTDRVPGTEYSTDSDIPIKFRRIIIMKNYRMQSRTILQLDFHNSPKIPNMGKDFNPEEFAETIKKAGIGVITLFAKCHLGKLQARFCEGH